MPTPTQSTVPPTKARTGSSSTKPSISSKKIAITTHDDSRQQRRDSNSGRRHAQEERDPAMSSSHQRGRSSSGGATRDQPSPRQSSNGNSNGSSRPQASPKQHRSRSRSQSRSSTMDNLAGYKMEPPPPPPPPATASPTLAKKSGSSKKKPPQQSRQESYPQTRSPQHHHNFSGSMAETTSSGASATSTFSRSQMIENPSSASLSYAQQHQNQQQRAPPPPPPLESSWDPSAMGSSSSEWMVGFGSSGSQRTPILPPPPSSSRHRSGVLLPPSSNSSPRNLQQQQQQETGFLHKFFGNQQQKKKKQTKKTALMVAANDVLEIGSEDTMTAGDLMVEESILLSSSTATYRQEASPLSGRGQGAFFSDDPHKHRAAPPPRNTTPQQQQQQSPQRKKELTGDYLQSKLMQLHHHHSPSYQQNHHQQHHHHHLQSHDSDDQTEVSNLTNPSVFANKNTLSPTKSSTMMMVMASPNTHKTSSPSLPRSPNKSSYSGQSSSYKQPPSAMSDPFDGPSFSSWGDSGNNDAALGRALDMQFTPSTTRSAIKVPPLLPKPSTAASSAKVLSSAAAASPRQQRARSRSPSPSPASHFLTTPKKQPTTTMTTSQRQVSPFRKRMETVNKKQHLLVKKQQPPPTSSNKPSPLPNNKNASKKQTRSSSASPADKRNHNSAVTPKKGTIHQPRSMSASRSSRAASPQQSRKAGSANTSIAARSRASSHMEPLSQVMSRVPSSLASRSGTKDSMNTKPKKKGSVAQRSPSPSTRQSPRGTPTSSSKPKNFIEMNRQASSRPSGRTGLKVRDSSPARKTAASSKDLSRKKAAAAPVVKTKAKLFPTSLAQLKAMRSPARAPSPPVKPKKVSTSSKPSYVPRNAYAGRFTPKKKKDKLTEIMATRDNEAAYYGEVASSAIYPARKQVPRHVGAQKLQNMIKLKNHFTYDSEDSLSRKSRGATSYNGGSYFDRSVLPASHKARLPNNNDRMTMIREHGLIDSFSVGGSDLRSIRSAVQSRFSSDHSQVDLYKDGSYFENYERDRIGNPAQRAGVRLLSSAVIPIQAAARRFLARREALSMLWAAIVIQARFRSFLEETRYEIKVYAAMRIQAAARGMLVRDRLMFEDYCATEIQRHVRGHLAAVRVYETIYKISLVQSQVRMKLAIKDATIRMYCVFKIQSVARRYLVRSRLTEANTSATNIQRCVRGYLASIRVYEEIYKITQVQNRFRRKQAIDKATIRMSLILSLQAIARGYLVRCRLDLAHYHAGTIQRYVRGYLGTMHVYEEIYKIMLIQNFFRMKIATNVATKRMTMIISVQANWRRYCVMRRMEYAHSNANTIQRYVRGYIATMSVYEEIYKITLVQNFVRMKIAMALAHQRKTMIHKTQAIVRGFILRGRLTKIREKAITIQTTWRSFYYRLVYQFKLLDIIIVQSVWRKRVACRDAKMRRAVMQAKAATVIQSRWRCYDAHETYLQFKIEDKAATIIQTRWRCYDTSMDYLHYLADVLIVQSMVRRWFAMREVTGILEEQSIVLQRLARGYLGRVYVKKTKSAVAIQKTWRGFVSFADYMFKVADIVMLQTVARRLLAYRRANYLRNKIDHDAATVIQQCRRRQLHRRESAAVMIQKTWRGLVQEADFVIHLYEYRSARTIQTYWRRFWKFSNYLICLDCSIRIQAVTRGFLARCKYADKQWGAVIIQASARGIIGKRRTTSKKMLESQTLTSQAIGSLQSMAATVIQANVRGFQSRGSLDKFYAACVIQTLVRGYLEQVMGEKHIAAVEIQKHWRKVVYHSAYTRFVAARRIQNCYRSVNSRRVVLCRKAETIAATAIQSSWRGYLHYTNYLFSLCDIVKVQSICRRWLAQKKAKEICYQKASASAVTIQTAWRGFYSYTCFLITLSEIVRLQRFTRQYLERKRYQSIHATKIQNTWRCFCSKKSYNYTITNTRSATLIQKLWRQYFCRSNYSFIVTDIVKVQTEVRRYLAQKVFLEMWEDHAIKSVVKIQATWRSRFAFAKYLAERKQIIAVQTAVRSFLARRAKIRLHENKRFQSATLLQGAWRRHKVQTACHSAISNVCFLQYHIRRFLAVNKKERKCATLIQTTYRSYLWYSAYSLTYYDILKAQSAVRAYIARKEYRQLCLERDTTAAIRIQAAFRGWTTYADYVCKKTAVLDIQRYWRGFRGRVGLFVAWKRHVSKINRSATEIQKSWRGYVTMQRYLYKLGSAIEIQSLARRVIVQARIRRRTEAATQIQSLRRKFLARHVMLDLFSKKTYQQSKLLGATDIRAARSIQKMWRKVLVCKLKQKKSFVVQSFMKHAVATRFLQKQIAARKICVFFRQSYAKRLSPVERLAIRMNACAIKIQRWYPYARRLRVRRQARAGRTILRFFRMVQIEVDKAIEMEIQRRKQKKVLKKRIQKKDDAILDLAWEKTSGNVGLDRYRRIGPGKSIPSTPRAAKGDMMLQETLEELQSRTTRGNPTMYAAGPPPPSPRSHHKANPPPMLSLADGLDEESLMGPATPGSICMSPSAFNRPSPSRIRSFSQKEFDEDYCLEEAFLDAEIHNARHRRHSEKRVKNSSTHQHHRKQRSVGGSGASVASVSSRVSTSSRGSRDARAPPITPRGGSVSSSSKSNKKQSNKH